MDSQTEQLADTALLALWKLHSRLVERDYSIVGGDVLDLMTELEQRMRRLMR